MFAEEKPTLLPLPLEPFRYYQHGQRIVHLDGCVEVEAAYYGLPPGWIGRQVNVQWDELYVRILHPHTGPVAARTCTPETWLVPHPKRGPPQKETTARIPATLAGQSGRLSHRHPLRPYLYP